MQIIIEILALCVIGISGIYAFIKSTAQRVKSRVEEIKDGKITNSIRAKNHIVSNDPYKSGLYQLIEGLSNTLVAEVEMPLRRKSVLESNMLFISACQLLAKQEHWGLVVQPLLKALLRQMNQEGCSWTLEDIADRMELYKSELARTFQEERYYGGIITYLLLENPLSYDIERSDDIASTLELIVGIREAFKHLGAYLKANYNADVFNH